MCICHTTRNHFDFDGFATTQSTKTKNYRFQRFHCFCIRNTKSTLFAFSFSKINHEFDSVFPLFLCILHFFSISSPEWCGEHFFSWYFCFHFKCSLHFTKNSIVSKMTSMGFLLRNTFTKFNIHLCAWNVSYQQREEKCQNESSQFTFAWGKKLSESKSSGKRIT